MTEPDDSLEAELGTMRPVAISTQLRRRLADQLIAQPTPHATNVWLAPLSAGLAAAGLAAALLLWLWSEPTVAPDQVLNQSPLALRLNGTQPTVWRYHKAIRLTSADVDALLGERGESSSKNRDQIEVAAFTRSPAQLRTLIGDL
jgi:hypothetical protein